MQLANGMDDRSCSWLFTSARWADYGVYIILPVNPTTFELSKPLRSTQGETQRGKFMYVHRNPKSGSVIAPCNYTFEIPSGLILPQFNDEYITQARYVAMEYAKQMQALRNYVEPWSRTTNTPDNVDTAQAAEDRRNNVATQVSKYQARISNFKNEIPAPDQVMDYTRGLTAYSSNEQNFVDTYNNVPDLYLPNIPIGIQNFYAFIMLMDEPRVYKSPITGQLRNNQIIVHFNSIELPSMTFYGWQDQGGISFTEDVEDYGQFNISFSLFVTASTPGYGIGKFGEMLTSYKAEIASSATSLDRLKHLLKSRKVDSLARQSR